MLLNNLEFFKQKIFSTYSTTVISINCIWNNNVNMHFQYMFYFELIEDLINSLTEHFLCFLVVD